MYGIQDPADCNTSLVHPDSELSALLWSNIFELFEAQGFVATVRNCGHFFGDTFFFYKCYKYYKFISLQKNMFT